MHVRTENYGGRRCHGVAPGVRKHCSQLVRAPNTHGRPHYDPSDAQTNMSNSRCKGEVGWGGRVKPFHSRVDMCSSILRIPPPILCLARATVGVKGEVGWGGWEKPFHSRVDIVLLHPANTSLLQVRTSTHKYRRIGNIIGAQSPPPNDAQCPGESERGKCRGGWVGV